VKRKFFAVLVLSICCLPLFAAGGRQDDAVATGKTFGYVPTNMNNPFFHAIEDSIREIVEARGDKLISVDPQSDPQRQLNLTDDLIRQKVAGIFLCPIDSDGVKDALLSCQRNNIPVIVFDNGVADSHLVVSTVQSNNYNAGKVVGEDMLAQLPNGGKVAILSYPSALSCRLRVQGFKDAVAGKLQVVAEFDGGADTAKSLPLAVDSLTANPDLAAFFAINDPSALGAVQAIAEAKKTGILVYSVDGAPEGKIAIQEGKLTGTGAQSPINVGKTSAEMMYKHLNGEKVEVETLVDTFIINKSNVAQYNPTGWQ
jgi:ribose transport system substrate-binding protein